MKHFACLILFLLSVNTFSQEDISYQKPSAEILALADYERPPSVSMDTKKEYMLLSYRNTYKTLDELNQEEMRLGGLRINPCNEYLLYHHLHQQPENQKNKRNCS